MNGILELCIAQLLNITKNLNIRGVVNLLTKVLEPVGYWE